MRKHSTLGTNVEIDRRDMNYNHHDRGSGLDSKSTDGPIEAENAIDNQVANHAIATNDAANAMSEHGLPKK